MLPPWVAAYIGIPFIPLGRTLEGCDCYGLVRLVLQREFGRELPPLLGDYGPELDPASIQALIGQELPLLAGKRLAAPELGAVAVVRISLIAYHLGLYVGEGLILHSRDRRTGSALERESAPIFRGRIEAYYHVL